MSGAAQQLELLPDSHSDFPFRVSVESWWPPILVGAALVVGLAWLLRRRTRR